MIDNAIWMWNIFDSPEDYPGRVVVRRVAVRSGGIIMADPEPWALCESLDGARQTVPPEANVRMAAHPTEDVPSLVETWF